MKTHVAPSGFRHWISSFFKPRVSREDERANALIEASKNDHFEPLESVLEEIKTERELPSRAK